MKRSELVKAAKELNETLGLDPQINVKEKPEALTALIKEAAGLIDPELDDFTDGTLSVIAELTKEEGKKSKKVEKEKVVEKKEETAEEEEFKESKEAVKMMEDARKEKKVNESGIPKHEGSMAEFVDKLMEKGITWEALVVQANKEAERRGINSLRTLGALKQHAKFRAKKNTVDMDEKRVKITFKV